MCLVRAARIEQMHAQQQENRKRLESGNLLKKRVSPDRICVCECV